MLADRQKAPQDEHLKHLTQHLETIQVDDGSDSEDDGPGMDGLSDGESTIAAVRSGARAAASVAAGSALALPYNLCSRQRSANADEPFHDSEGHEEDEEEEDALSTASARTLVQAEARELALK